jgi:hypothetical protein
VLVAATLSSLVFALIYAILSTSTQMTDAIAAVRSIEADADAIVSRLRADVETGRVVTAIDSVLSVASDSDTVTYTWDGATAGTLVRSLGGNSDTLSVAVSALSFLPRTFTYDRTIEALTTVDFPTVVASFVPNDWDDFVGADPLCSYLAVGAFMVSGTDWVGVSFQTNTNVTSFTGARVYARRAPGASGEDLVLEVYRASSTPPYYPETLLAQAFVNTASMSSTAGWIAGTFVPIDPAPVPRTTDLWMVARGPDPGSGRIARLEYAQLDCPSAPANGISSYTSTDGGGTWSARLQTEEFYFVIDATDAVEGLVEITNTQTDTTGVQVTIAVTHDTTTEERVLEIASIDL